MGQLTECFSKNPLKGMERKNLRLWFFTGPRDGAQWQGRRVPAPGAKEGPERGGPGAGPTPGPEKEPGSSCPKAARDTSGTGEGGGKAAPSTEAKAL